MSVDVKALFDELGVPYKTRGRNIGRNYFGLKCPFCGDDPSEHLGVHTRTGGYHCWRDDRHSGSDVYYLLRALGIPHARIKDSLGRHDDGEDIVVENVEKPVFTGWKGLNPAVEQRHLMYLYSRGFNDPVTAVRTGDLRCSNIGKARWRILFPMISKRGVEGWTGRSIHPQCEPRYETECVNADRCIVGSFNAPNLLAVEGPIDALKLNCALNNLGKVNYAAFAFHGRGLSEGQYRMLVDLRPTRVLVCPDRDDEGPIFGFRSLEMFTQSKFLKLVGGYKDFGEMPIAAVEQWLKENVDAEDQNSLRPSMEGPV